MDTFELNKIAGALLFTFLIVLGLDNLASIIYKPHQPEKPGYEIAVPETDKAEKAEVVKEAKEEVSLAKLLVGADVDAGQKLAKKCVACHTFDKGGANKIGPNLYGILGRKMASISGFSYSSAMKGKAESVDSWSFEAMDSFLTKPKDFVPKTKMAFSGVKKPQARANLVAYLRSLSDSPIALPADQ